MNRKVMCALIFLIIMLKSILEMLLFKTTLKPVPQLLSGAMTIFLFGLAGCLLQFVFMEKKDRSLKAKVKTPFKSQFSTLFNKSAHGLLFALTAGMIVVVFRVLSTLSVFIAMPVAAVALYMNLITICFQYTRATQTPAAALKSAIKWILKDPLKALAGFAAFLLSAGCVIAFHRVFKLGMSAIHAPVVLAFVYLQLFTALICGLVFGLLLKTVIGFLPGPDTPSAENMDSAILSGENDALQHPTLAESTEIHSAASRKSVPRPLITAAALLALSAGILLIPRDENIYTQLAKHAEEHRRQADALSETEEVSEQGRQYRKAAVTYGAMSEFMAGESVRYDKRMDEAEKKKKMDEYSGRIQKLFTLEDQNTILQYLNGVRLFNSGDIGQAAVSMKNAYEQLSDFACVRFDYLKTCVETKDALSLQAVTEDIIRSGEFSCKPLIESPKAYLTEKSRNEVQQLFLHNLALSTGIAQDYYENKLYTEAQVELDKLFVYLPENDFVDRLMALVDLELKADGKPYDTALKAAERLKNRYPEDKEMLLFCASVEWSAHSREQALATMLDCQMRFPQDIQVAENYLSMLFESIGTNKMNDFDRQSEIMADRTLEIAPDSWFSYWVKACLLLKQMNFPAALQNLVAFSKILEPYGELRQDYDDYIYRFAYEYAAYFKKPEAVAALEAIREECSFAYCYIQGIYSLNVDQYEQADNYMSQIIKNSGEFAKVRFTLGSIAYEQSIATQQPDLYKKAEAEYKASLLICPENAYCWFSLGLLYDRMKEYELSLGAMRKASALLPYLDHRSDSKGVSYHSAKLVKQLEKYLADAERS